MKMAKASEADLNMAMTLANYLDAIERGQMPDDLSEDAEAIEWLDERDCDQYAKLLDGLRRLLNQGSISRVIWGMAVVCDPANKCLDPDADTIEHHPDLVKAAEQRDELLAAAQAMIDRWDTPLWKDVPSTAEYINALRNAVAKVKA